MGITSLLSLALTAGQAGLSPAVFLADSIDCVAALSDSLALCTNLRGEFFTISIPSGERDEWVPSWQPADDGWLVRKSYPYSGYVFLISVSPDRAHVAYAECVYLPERHDIPEDVEGMRGCFVVVVCDADGGNAMPVAIGIEVGGGPEYDFTADSRRLVGQPLYACLPTPEGYAEFLRRGWDNPVVAPFDFIDVATGERGTIPDLNVSDGYWKCPYGDYFRIENNWYEEHDFSSFETGGVVGSYSVPDGESGRILGWILPDAVLLEGSESRRILQVDGRTMQGPPSSWDLYGWLPDGMYLFSMDEGRTILHGNVDWTTSEVSDATACPGLEAFIEESFIPLPGSGGVLLHTSILWGSGLLTYYPMP